MKKRPEWSHVKWPRRLTHQRSTQLRQRRVRPMGDMTVATMAMMEIIRKTVRS